MHYGLCKHRITELVFYKFSSVTREEICFRENLLFSVDLTKSFQKRIVRKTESVIVKFELNKTIERF